MKAVNLAELNHRILIVDDNPAIHEDLRKVLASEGDPHSLEPDEMILFGTAASPVTRFELDFAYQGQEGLEKVSRAVAEGRPYALAFVDIRMPPGWDGVETITHFRKADPNLQTVICTAYADYSWEDIERRLGRSDSWLILKKPFDNVEVIQLAHALSQKWLASRQAEVKMALLNRIVAERTTEAKAASQQYRIIAETASDGIITLDQADTIRFANRSAGRLFGYTPAELTGRNFSEFVAVAGQPARSATCLPGSSGPPVELAGTNRDGSQLTLEVSISDSLDCGQDRTRTVVIRDVTARKRLERSEGQARKLESIGRLASGVAHEINTPIQYIGDNLLFIQRSSDLVDRIFDILQRSCENESGGGGRVVAELRKIADQTTINQFRSDVPTAIKEAIEGVEQVAAIVRAMNEFAHPGVSEMALTDVNHLIESTVLISRTRWKSTAEMELDLDPELPRIRCAAGELRQVLLNLVINAADAVLDKANARDHGKGTISISSKQQGNWLELRVRDTGVGIPQGLHSRIFDPFFTTKPVGRGSGQGLAIAHTIIVQRHRGTIDFETALGEGTTFIVRLPIERAEPVEEDPAIELEAVYAGAAGAARDRHESEIFPRNL